MSRAVVCPRCRNATSEPVSPCPRCGGDLTPLVRLVALADTRFDAAVRAAREEHWDDAAEHAAVALALLPDDVDAMVLLAKVSYRQGRRERAVALWTDAAAIAPHRTDVAAALRIAATRPRPWRRVRDLAPSRQQLATAAPSRSELAEGLHAVRSRLRGRRDRDD